MASTSLDSHKFWPLADRQSFLARQSLLARQSFLARREFLDRKDFPDRRDRSCWPIARILAKSTVINADGGNPFPTTMPQRKSPGCDLFHK
jgi:hypothetical protein